VRFLRTRPKPSAPARAAEGDPGPYRNRYDIAREGYEVRVSQLARALDQSSLKNYLSAIGNIVLGIGIVTIALRGGVRPIFVPYDQFGRVIQYDDLSRFKNPPRAMVEAELSRWLVNVRGIYHGDPIAQLDRARAAKQFLTPEAEQWLNQYFSAASRNPAHLLHDLTRTVEVVSISKDPDRNLWYMQWRELDVPARGAYVESAWQGTFKVDFLPGRTEEAVWANPTGIRISSIEWNRMRERVSSPTSPVGSSAPAAPDPQAVPPPSAPGARLPEGGRR
jgi:type IV secretion system protein TrbF